MTSFYHQNNKVQRHARVVLLLFVVSVLNMAFQVPVHAAMQLFDMPETMAHNHSHHNHSQMNHSAMNHGDMLHANSPVNMDECCPPSLCESVDANTDQLSAESVSVVSINFDQLIPALVITLKDTRAHLSSQRYEISDLRYRQASPPPIQFTTELQI